jgi:hypothetical protein
MPKQSVDAVSSHVDLIARLQENVKTLVASFLSFGALMFISFAHFSQLEQILSTVGCVACGSLLVVTVRDIYRIRCFRLHRLASDEKETLNAFVQNGKKTIHWYAGDDNPMSLSAEGIISLVNKSPGYPDDGYAWYTIKPWIFNYLSEHRELIDLPKRETLV